MNLSRPGSDSPRRARRSLRPGIEALGRRELPSGFAAATPAPAIAAPTFVHHHGPGHRDTIDPSGPSLGSSAGPTTAPDGSREIAGITYTRDGSKAQQLDLYLPAGTPPPGGWPILLAFPGGGWRWADRKSYGKEVATAFNPEGYAVAAVDYTYAGSADDGSHSWPANLEDGQAAVRWAREHAGRFRLNPDKVVAIGESAGAHLALLLGTYPEGPVATDTPGTAASTAPAVSSRPNAVVDFYGPTDLTALYNQGRVDAHPYFDTFLGGPPTEYPGRYAAASPITYVNRGDSPILIVQGLKDPTNIPSQSYELDAALTKAGVPHRLIAIPRADHGFGLDLPGQDLVPDILSFLDSALNPSRDARLS